MAHGHNAWQRNVHSRNGQIIPATRAFTLNTHSLGTTKNCNHHRFAPTMPVFVNSDDADNNTFDGIGHGGTTYLVEHALCEKNRILSIGLCTRLGTALWLLCTMQSGISGILGR